MTDPAIAQIMAIEGGIDEAEAFHLFALAQCVRDGCIVEVGSWRGRSTAALALGSKRAYKVPVYAIEPHESFAGIYGGNFGPADRVEFFKNMLTAGVVDVVRLVNLPSRCVTPGWSQSVGLLWIDGDHSYKAVREDVSCWLPHLRPDATMVFHDANDDRIGPTHVVEELIRGGKWRRGPEISKTKTLFRVPSEKLDSV